MNKNIGSPERLIRIIVGLALIVWTLFFHGPVWAWIGVMPLLTGLAGWCPPYKLLGINTCKMKK